MPRIVVLRPNDDGQIKITAMTERTETQINRVAPFFQERVVCGPLEVDIADVKELKLYDITGKEVPRGDALAALANGGVVVVSGDGKPVDPAFLATFRESTMVLVAPGLVLGAETRGGWYAAP